MNNISNLGASQAAPAIQGLAGQAATQGDNSSLFSALLMQQMGPDVTGAGDSGAMPDLGQGISGYPELAKLFQTMAAQAKNSTSAMPPNRQTDNPDEDPNGNPAMAIWIAMAAAQMQPSTPISTAQLNSLSSQSIADGTEQNSALQALEQQFPGLAQALKDSRLADAGAQARKSSAQPTTGKTDFATPNLAKAEHDASTASNAAPTAEQQKSDAPQAAAPVHTDIIAVPVIAAPVASVPTVATPAVSNAFAISDKGKVDQKDLAGIAAAKNSPGTVTPTASQNTSAQSLASQNVNSQNQGSDAKSQGQAPSGDGHSGNQSKKDSASATQSQQPANGDSARVTTADQTNFAAVAQAAAHTTSSSNSTSHTTSPAADQSLNVREVTGALGAEAAPRVVHAARLMEAAGQAEMRVSVKSDVSGTVDVRAVLEGGSISATVAAQHGGTRDWMMANMHELQNTFSRDDLNLKTFEVTDSALQNNGQGEQPGQQEQQQRNPAYANFMSEPLSPSTTSFDEVEAPETTSRALSLLA
ncbi:MAG TPA: flagellar hook-length control protein FliK [Candidatus Angelobacter sp.]